MRVLLFDQNKEEGEQLTSDLYLFDDPEGRYGEIDVDLVCNRERAKQMILDLRYDVIVCDILIRGGRGLDLLRYVADNRPTTPLIAISGEQGVNDEVTLIVHRTDAYYTGAWGYLAKPLSARELLAYALALARRTTRVLASVMAVQVGQFELNQPSREIKKAGRVLDLTTGEFDLLSAFIQHANEVLDRDTLLMMARHREPSLFDRTIDVQVGRLRKKVGDDPQRPTTIRSVRGAGYIFTP